MVSTRFGIRSETPLADSHPHPATMIDAHTLQQLQNRNAEMEQCHEEELTKLEAHVRCPRGDEQSAHTLAKCTQGESHPRHTGNTADDLSPSYMHHQATWTIRWHPFINHIMEKRNKCEEHTKPNTQKLDKRHKSSKRQSLSKGSRYERYTPLMANRATILEEAFNLDIPIRLPETKPPRSGLDAMKYCHIIIVLVTTLLGLEGQDRITYADRVLSRVCQETRQPSSRSKTQRIRTSTRTRTYLAHQRCNQYHR
ncbi:hypothetical protein JHK86_016095 [Glycine max]|nr:hypothetical protein JHK86_016095 [Glycine max]